jgi:hypothetical protein
MTIEEAKEFVDSHEWTFAKSMPKIPHWYILREKVDDTDGFDNLIATINKLGYKKKFWKAEYIYLHLGDYKYWSVAEDSGFVRVINRAKV